MVRRTLWSKSGVRRLWQARRIGVHFPFISCAQATERFRPARPRLAVARAVNDRSQHSAAIIARALIATFTATLEICACAPASAQVTGAVSAESDFRLRGYSMSGGRPVASARIGVDQSGFYADGSATVVLTRGDDARFLGYQVDAGMAKRVGHDWVVDVGVAHNDFRAAFHGGFPYTYTEGYIGATGGPISTYLFVSPNYYRPGFWTIYGQIESSVAPAKNWTLTAHFGALNHLYTPEPHYLRHKTLYDWRVGATREFGNFELHMNLSGGRPGRQYYYGDRHSRTAVVAGGSLSF